MSLTNELLNLYYRRAGSKKDVLNKIVLSLNITSSKIGLRQLVATIVLQLHAKFRKDPMTGYREKLRTNGRTDRRTWVNL